MPSPRLLSIPIAALCALLSWGQAVAGEVPTLRLVATTGMVADIVREVGDERVEVQGLMGPGVDPHLYRQTRSDVVAMSRADAVFWNGLSLEVQLAELLERLARRRPVFAVAEAVPPRRRPGPRRAARTERRSGSTANGDWARGTPRVGSISP